MIGILIQSVLGIEKRACEKGGEPDMGRRLQG